MLVGSARATRLSRPLHFVADYAIMVPMRGSPVRTIGIAGVAVWLASAGCNSGTSTTGGTSGPRNNLSAMETTTLTIGGKTFLVWVARTPREHEVGLMNVTAQEMAPLPDGTERGMLFVFDREQVRQFWMLNTIIPLDVAFLRSDGQIVKTHTMAPYETRLYSSMMPAMMALEVNAGVFARFDIAAGDVAQIPEAVLKPVQP